MPKRSRSRKGSDEGNGGPSKRGRLGNIQSNVMETPPPLPPRDRNVSQPNDPLEAAERGLAEGWDQLREVEPIARLIEADNAPQPIEEDRTPPSPYGPNEWRGDRFPLTRENLQLQANMGAPPPDFRVNYRNPTRAESIEMDIASSERRANRLRAEAQRLEEDARRRRASLGIRNMQNTAGQLINRAVTPIRNVLSAANNSVDRTRRNLLEPGARAIASGAMNAMARAGEGIFDVAQENRINRLGVAAVNDPGQHAINLEHRDRLRNLRSMSPAERVRMLQRNRPADQLQDRNPHGGGARKLTPLEVQEILDNDDGDHKKINRRSARRTNRKSARRTNRRTGRRS